MAWRCKKCGKEILANVEVWDDFEFLIDKQGKIDVLSSYSADTIEDVIRDNPYSFETLYFCPKCGEDADELEDIAEWEDDR